MVLLLSIELDILCISYLDSTYVLAYYLEFFCYSQYLNYIITFVT
jgi:hypothetical protein